MFVWIYSFTCSKTRHNNLFISSLIFFDPSVDAAETTDAEYRTHPRSRYLLLQLLWQLRLPLSPFFLLLALAIPQAVPYLLLQPLVPCDNTKHTSNRRSSTIIKYNTRKTKKEKELFEIFCDNESNSSRRGWNGRQHNTSNNDNTLMQKMKRLLYIYIYGKTAIYMDDKNLTRRPPVGRSVG